LYAFLSLVEKGWAWFRERPQIACGAEERGFLQVKISLLKQLGAKKSWPQVAKWHAGEGLKKLPSIIKNHQFINCVKVYHLKYPITSQTFKSEQWRFPLSRQYNMIQYFRTHLKADEGPQAKLSKMPVAIKKWNKETKQNLL
jgi:hypothetical protein